MSADTLGDRMKAYEAGTSTSLPPWSFGVLRVDGRAFHSWTRGLARPFDTDLAEAMDATALALCQEVQGAVLGFVESDEISVIYTDFGTATTQPWFGGKVQKQTSIAASVATAAFADACRANAALSGRRHATFDARVFTVPDAVEAANYVIWRQRDALRNSVAMAAQAVFSHRELQGKNATDMREMLAADGIYWEDYPDRFRRGGLAARASGLRDVTYVDKRDQTEKTITAERSWWEIAGAGHFTVDLLLPLLPVRSDGLVAAP